MKLIGTTLKKILKLMAPKYFLVIYQETDAEINLNLFLVSMLSDLLIQYICNFELFYLVLIIS